MERTPMKIEFKFDIDQLVTTMFGEAGVVAMAAVDDGRKIMYSVKTKDTCMWYKESELKENE